MKSDNQSSIDSCCEEKGEALQELDKRWGQIGYLLHMERKMTRSEIVIEDSM